MRTRRTQGGGYRLALTIAADGFYGAAFLRFFAESFFLGTFGLFVDVRMAAVVVAFVIRGRGFAAEIAVDALVIDIKLPRYVFRIFIRCVSHMLPAKSEVERRKKDVPRNGFLRASAQPARPSRAKSV
jgi:hypothetical protein